MNEVRGKACPAMQNGPNHEHPTRPAASSLPSLHACLQELLSQCFNRCLASLFDDDTCPSVGMFEISQVAVTTTFMMWKLSRELGMGSRKVIFASYQSRRCHTKLGS